MRFTRVEFVFIALGAALGAIVAFAAKAGWVGASSPLPPFVLVLLGLGAVELGVGLATKSSPGSLIGMPARMLAFVVGVGVLALLNGGLG